MVFHKRGVCVPAFLLFLWLLCAASRGAQQYTDDMEKAAELQIPSLKDRTRPPHQDEEGRKAADHALTNTREVSTKVPPLSSTTHGQQNTSQMKAQNMKESLKADSLQVDTILQESRTREVEESNGGKKEKATQRVTKSSGWFTKTLNVTLRPVVTWSRRGASHSLPAPTPGKASQEEEQDRVEEDSDRDEEWNILLTVTFMKDGHPLILDLHPNRDLLAASYRESSGGEVGGDNTLPGETETAPCEYQGVVRGFKEAWTALSVCGGLSGVVSMTSKEGEEVELLVEPSPGSTSSHEPHRVYSTALLNLPETTCGVKDARLKDEVEKEPEDSTAHEDERKANDSYSSYRRARRWVGLVGGPLWFQANTRFVELVLVADHSFYTMYGDETRSRCKALVNIVNAVYRPLGVVVVLTHLEVWEHGDKIHVTKDYMRNLNLFKDYRKKMLQEQPDYNNDNTMLLTAVDFKGNTVGYAVVSGMCGISGSAGVVQDKQQHVGVVAYTVSHEMGHNFGMKHDEDMKRSCQCATHSCIMSSNGSPKFNPSTSWSSCSRQVVEKNLDSVSYQCLRNVPTRKYLSHSCGDGVVDDGEQCDCGHPEYCENPCCVAATCRLAANASCATGPCCDIQTCELKPQGTECRAPFTECDVPEFCSGDSESCPEDLTKADGEPCRGGQGYCYKAKCGSHEGQCQGVWGHSARVAESACYSKLNLRGGSNGNCGFKEQSTDLLPCADSDELCGTLQCLPEPNAQPQLGVALNYGTFSFSRYSCSYIVSSDTIPSRFWLTPDGAKCGEGKMCINQKCVKVPELVGHCEGGCSGHGVCNSRNHCHCDQGFAPPDCSEEGTGGSIDSSQIGRNRYKDPLMEAIYVLSLIALGLAIITCCLWDHIRRCWETSGRERVCPCCARCLDVCCCPLMSFIIDRLCSTKKRGVSKEARDDCEQDSMICRVDLDFKNNQPKNNSRDVADSKLPTGVITMTPKNFPDFRRKILLPSNHSARHPETEETPERPSYMPSVSVDSGCVPDAEEVAIKETYDSRMSMKSLARTFKNFSIRKSPSPPKTIERQRSVPLSRFVVDPLAGSRRSRQGTPPPGHVKPEWRRSISVDAKTNTAGHPGTGVPPTPSPASSKPYKSKIISFKKIVSTNQSVTIPRDAHPEDNRQDSSILKGKNPRSSPVTPAPTSQLRKPMMPPGKQRKTAVCTKVESSNESQVRTTSSLKPTQEKVNTSPKLHQNQFCLKRQGPMLPKSCESSKPQATTDVPSSLIATSGRVKELAKILEKQ